MDLNRMALFEAVARTGSFSTAARELGLPKSSASRGVARLEESLGVQLLFRTTRRVSLTAAGRALHERAAPLLEGLRAAAGELPERDEEPSGLLRVTAPVDLGLLVLAQVVTRLVERYPSVRVELNLTSRVVDLVGEGFDVALRAAPALKDSSLVARKVASVSMVLFASPRYLAARGTPRTAADLGSHEWVVFRGGPRKLRLDGPRGAVEVVPDGRVVCDDLLFLRDAVRAGAGIGLLPAALAEPEVAAGDLVRVLPRFRRAVGHLYIVCPAARHVPRKVVAFRDLVIERISSGWLP